MQWNPRRVIAGYALGEDGMMFRGELVKDCNEEDAWQRALALANNFSEFDADDDHAANDPD